MHAVRLLVRSLCIPGACLFGTLGLLNALFFLASSGRAHSAAAQLSPFFYMLGGFYVCIAGAVWAAGTRRLQFSLRTLVAGTFCCASLMVTTLQAQNGQLLFACGVTWLIVGFVLVFVG